MVKVLDKRVALRLRCEKLSNCLDMPKGADQSVTKVPVLHCVACDFSIVEILEIEDYVEERPDVKSVVEKQDELGLG